MSLLKLFFVLYFLGFLYTPVHAHYGFLDEKENIFFSLKEFREYESIMLLIDPETGAILAASKGAQAFYLYDDLTRENITEINTLTAEEVYQEMQNAQREERNFFNFRHTRGDGSVRDVHVVSYPMRLRDTTVLLTRVRDVTRDNALLRMNRIFYFLFSGLLIAALMIMIYLNTRYKKSKEEALQASQYKSAFLASMSHEIKTPLHGISGFLSLLQEKETDQENKTYLDALETSAHHLSRIINDILTLAQIDAGKYLIEEEETTVFSDIDSALLMYRVISEKKGVAFSVDIDEQLKTKMLKIDAKSILILINNVVSNAVKFTPQGYVQVSVALKDARLQLRVKDTGIGMSEHAQKRLFEPFYQGKDAAHKKHQGTGLGLSIVKKLVTLMNGELHIFSQQDKGTEVYVSLPCEVSPVVPERVSKDTIIPKLNTPGLKILSVEDVEINQVLLQSYFKNEAVFFTKAYNGEEALIALEKDDYDIILMDIQMPVLNGIDATKILRKKEAYKNMPVLAISAYVDEQNIQEMRDAGITDYILKPVHKKTLFEKIHQLIKKSG